MNREIATLMFQGAIMHPIVNLLIACTHATLAQIHSLPLESLRQATQVSGMTCLPPNIASASG